MNDSQNIFLLDGIGALVSAFFLGFVLVHWQSAFGMPRSVLYWLAGIAFCFASYSLSCFVFKRAHWRLFLKGIMLANVCYCLLTFVLVLIHFEKLTALGVLYFFGEILIILGLVWFENGILNN